MGGVAMAKRGRPAVEINLSADERETLQRWARRHSSSQALALRSRVVLACADPELAQTRGPPATPAAPLPAASASSSRPAARASHHLMARSPEQGQVGGAEGTEAGVAAPAVGSRPAQGIERGDTFAFQGRGGQGVEVAVVGRDPHLVGAPQVAHARSHGAPPPLAPARVAVTQRAIRVSRGLLMVVPTRRTALTTGQGLAPPRQDTRRLHRRRHHRSLKLDLMMNLAFGKLN
jgi:hypothetical protein